MTQRYWSWGFELLCIAIIAAGALFHASVSSYPANAINFGSMIILALLLTRITLTPQAKICYPPQMVYILGFVILIILQMLPLPMALVKILSPHEASLLIKYMPQANDNSWFTLSIYTLPTKYALAEFLAFIILFICAVNFPSERGTFHRLFAGIIILGTLLALYGIAYKYFLKEGAGGAFGTFTNRNHFAAFLTIIAPLSIGYALSCEDRFKKIVFLFFGALITASIFLSLSRAGSLSVMVSFFILFLLLRKELALKGKFFIAGISLFLVIIFLAGAGLGSLQGRFESLFKEGLKNDRFLVACDSLKIIRDFPASGVGWGNFPYIFPLYKSFVSYGYYRQLHNDHLQLIVETGIAASFFYFLFIFVTLKNIFVCALRRHDRFVITTALGIACGLTGVMLHSLFDFNFHVPAIACLFWLMLGFAYKLVHIHFKND